MLNFGHAQEAVHHPLAKALFRIDGVTNVFLTADFITVNKQVTQSWEHLEPAIVACIQRYYGAEASFLEGKAE